MRTVLHVGCGVNTLSSLPPLFQDGTWDEIRYDIDDKVQPDIVGELQDLSIIEDGSIDALYSSHNIEHVWAFEVPPVLKEFRRVLKPDGFAMVLCPDVQSVAQAIAEGYLDKPLYVSPAGPITALDILYGFHSAIEKGNHFMAHKTAFTTETLASHLLRAGFAGIAVARDKAFGLHAAAFLAGFDAKEANALASQVHPAQKFLLEVNRYGDLAS